jgi:hypothetical protein
MIELQTMAVDTAFADVAGGPCGLKTLSFSQLAAKKSILMEVDKGTTHVFLKGFAGTGKTVVVKHVIKELEDIGFHCFVCTPTHKAASVLTNRENIKAGTIHRTFFGTAPIYKVPGLSDKCREPEAIEWVQKNKKMADFPDVCALLNHALKELKVDSIEQLPRDVRKAINDDFVDQALNKLSPELVSVISENSINEIKTKINNKPAVLIIDESSMLGWDVVELLNKLLRSFENLKSIIFVGDDHQLPPVDPNAERGSINYCSFFIEVEPHAYLTEPRRQEKTDFYGPLNFATDIRGLYNEPNTVMNRFDAQSNFIPPKGLNITPMLAKQSHYATIICYTNMDRVLLNNFVRRALHGDKYQVWPLPGDRIIAETNSKNGEYIKGSEYYVVSFDIDTCIVEVKDTTNNEVSKLYFSGSKTYKSFNEVHSKLKYPNKDISNSNDYFNKIKLSESTKKNKLAKELSRWKYYLSVERAKFEAEKMQNIDAVKSKKLLQAECSYLVAENASNKFHEMPRVSFDFAFALTCHKAQGSEFDTCIVLDKRHNDSRWIYTAVTRAKRNLFICETKNEVQNLIFPLKPPEPNPEWP